MEFTGICFNQNFQSDLKQRHHLSRTHTRQVLANEATNSGKCFNFLLYFIKAGMFYSEMFHLVWICYKQWYRQFVTCRGQNNSGYYRVVLEQDWAKNSSILFLCVCCVHTYCTCVCVCIQPSCVQARMWDKSAVQKLVCGLCLPADYSAAYWELLAVLL